MTFYVKLKKIPFQEMYLKMSSAKVAIILSRPQCVNRLYVWPSFLVPTSAYISRWMFTHFRKGSNVIVWVLETLVKQYFSQMKGNGSSGDCLWNWSQLFCAMPPHPALLDTPCSRHDMETLRSLPPPPPLFEGKSSVTSGSPSLSHTHPHTHRVSNAELWCFCCR